jgi:hypothetical protein
MGIGTLRARRAFLGASVAFVLAAGSARASFLPATSYPVGAPASAVGYGDYNGDGIPDLAVARSSQNDVVITLGRADGTFGPPSAPIPVGQDPVAVTSCIAPFTYPEVGPFLPIPDFNFDHHCDLAVSDAGSDDIAVLMGNGDGTFAAPKFLPVDGSPGAIAAGGLAGNAQGVAFVEPQQDRLGVIQGSSDGKSFSAPGWTAVGSDPVAVIDTVNFQNLQFNLYVADAGSNDVRAFTPLNDGSPGPQLFGDGIWHVGSSPRALAWGSFGVAVADHDSGDVTLIGYQQQGNRGTQAQSAPIPVGAAPVALTALTQPGGVASGDLAVLNEGAGTVTIMQQTAPGSPSDGTWPTFTSSTLPVPGAPTTLIGQPFRPQLDSASQRFASPPVTDVALLDPAGTVSVLLQQSPRLILAPKFLNFDQIAAGTSTIADAVVTNIGRIPGKVDHLGMFSTSWPGQEEQFSIDSDKCTGKTLAPGQSCTVAIRFAPARQGDFAWGMYAFGDTQPSSVLGAEWFHGSARLQARVSAPPSQPLSTALARGVQATAACSAACTVHVHAVLIPRGATAARDTVLGAASVSLKRGGIVRLHIPIRSAARVLASGRRARIVLRATVNTTADQNGITRPTSLTLSQVAVVLTSKTPARR